MVDYSFAESHLFNATQILYNIKSNWHFIKERFIFFRDESNRQEPIIAGSAL